MIWIYFLGAFLSCFFSCKRWGKDFNENYHYECWVDRKEFWYIGLITIWFPIAIPSMLGWMLLEKITKRFYK